MTYLFENGKIDLEKLDDSTYMLDILLNIESLLDDQDIYVFSCTGGGTFIDGEVFRGPIVRRHWVTVGIKFPYNRMPDPRAALRLLKIGVNVKYERMEQMVAGDSQTPDHEPKKPTDWLITLTIPRRLLDDAAEADLEYVDDDEINVDDVSAAQDSGIDDETAYNRDSQEPNSGMPVDGDFEQQGQQPQ